MAGDAKLIARIFFALALLFAFLSYTAEFIEDQNGYSWFSVKRESSHRGAIGFIVLFVVIIIWLIIGAVSAFYENATLAIIFAVGMLILTIVDAFFLGFYGTILAGAFATILAVVFFIFAMGYGGK